MRSRSMWSRWETGLACSSWWKSIRITVRWLMILVRDAKLFLLWKATDRLNFDISQFAASEFVYSSESEEFSRGADSCGKQSLSFLCALRHLWTRNTVEHDNVNQFRISICLLSRLVVFFTFIFLNKYLAYFSITTRPQHRTMLSSSFSR